MFSGDLKVPGEVLFIIYVQALDAERTGFEPVKPFRGLHAFQACLFNHSSISPNMLYNVWLFVFAAAKIVIIFRIAKFFRRKM